jgi:hypothetical protein
MNKVKRQNIKRKYALTLCMEFFRDELFFGAHTERLEKKYTELRELCWQALGSDQSVADANEIKKTYNKVIHGQPID